MSINLVLSLIICLFLSVGISGKVGYDKGYESAQLKAKVAMDAHLVEDREAEDVAKEKAEKKRVELETAISQAGEAYEKGKKDAQATAKTVTADLRTGNLVLRDRWENTCPANTNVPAPAPSPSEPDAGAGDREASAGRIVQAAATCDAQVRGLQDILRSERKKNVQEPQPAVGVHVGPLPD